MKITMQVPRQQDVPDALLQLHDCFTDPAFPASVAKFIVLTNFDGTRSIGRCEIDFEA